MIMKMFTALAIATAINVVAAGAPPTPTFDELVGQDMPLKAKKEFKDVDCTQTKGFDYVGPALTWGDPTLSAVMKGSGYKVCAENCARVEGCHFFTLSNGKCILKGPDAKTKKLKSNKKNKKKNSGRCTVPRTPKPTDAPTSSPSIPLTELPTPAPTSAPPTYFIASEICKQPFCQKSFGRFGQNSTCNRKDCNGCSGCMNGATDDSDKYSFETCYEPFDKGFLSECCTAAATCREGGGMCTNDDSCEGDLRCTRTDDFDARDRRSGQTVAFCQKPPPQERKCVRSIGKNWKGGILTKNKPGSREKCENMCFKNKLCIGYTWTRGTCKTFSSMAMLKKKKNLHGAVCADVDVEQKQDLIPGRD